MRPPLAAALADAARERPDADALLCGRERFTYAALASRVGAAAAWLAARGVRAGDRVLLRADSRRPGFALGYFACHHLGAIAVPVEAAASRATLDAVTQAVAPRLRAAEKELEELERAEGEAPPMHDAALDDPADVLHTGGTTGGPKGVVQTHRNILAFARGRNAAVGCAPGDRLVLPVPLSHGYGLGRLRAAVLAGSAVILVDGFAFPADVIGALEDQAGTSLCGVPSGFASLLAAFGDELSAQRGRLRYAESATAPLPAAVRDRLLALLPATRLYNSYGMTETCSSIAFVELGAAPGKRSSVGKPVAGAQLRIVDGRRRPLPPGRSGRVQIRGESVMPGYWNDAARTRRALSGGWLSANDLGRLDEDGYLYLEGRPEELINVGGLKVAPAEIEEALSAHPAVAECACAGAPDPAGLAGEAVTAYLVLKPGAGAAPDDRELSRFLAARLEAYKVPSRFVWLAALPRTRLGKLRRSSLKG